MCQQTSFEVLCADSQRIPVRGLRPMALNWVRFLMACHFEPQRSSLHPPSVCLVASSSERKI